MEKPTNNKAEYVAVPTSDVDQEAGLPAYEEHQLMTQNSPRRCKRFGLLFIGGAIVLLGLTHLCGGPAMKAFSEKYDLEVRPQDAPEPCTLNHFEPYQELKQHLQNLEDTYIIPEENYWNLRTLDQPEHHGYHMNQEDYPHHPHHPHHHHHKDQPKDDEPATMEEPQHHHHHHHGHKGHPHHHNNAQVLPEGLSLTKIEGRPRHHHPHGHPSEPFCKMDELEATSTVFLFSPEKFARAGLFLDGHFSFGSHVRLSKSVDKSLEDIKVNVTLYSGRNELQKEVKISAFDHKGQYAVQVERGRFHNILDREIQRYEEEDSDRPEKPPHHPDEDKKENCLLYNVDIVFPANLKYYEDLELKVREARRITGSEGLEEIEFGTLKAGLGRGAIKFDSLKAKKLLLGVLRGVVMGTYQPSERFAAGTVHGATKVNIEPTSDKINITASSTFGPASVDIPADSYEGDFTLFNLLGEPSTIQAPNPEDIHVTKYRPHLKSGYYKKEHTGSRIIVAAKIHGGERLSFN